MRSSKLEDGVMVRKGGSGVCVSMDERQGMQLFSAR